MVHGKFINGVALFACLLVTGLLPAQEARDWAQFNRYAQENDSLRSIHAEIQVVFLGNSITQGWRENRPEFFAEHGFIGRGINGQTTSEMLVRMRQDVIDLHPQIVVILAGTNDIAQNNGYISPEHILGNIISMCELAQANHIRPVLCSLLPARRFYWTDRIPDAPVRIQQMNALIRAYAETHDIPYVDYWSQMAADDGGLQPGLSDDDVHPTVAGYLIMEPLILHTLSTLGIQVR